MRLKRFFGVLFGLVVLASPLVLAAQRQAVADWWRLRDYDAPPAISSLADQTTMNDLGRKLFYVHKPELKDRSTFGSSCPNFEETIVLGCYITHSRIYLFDVTDERLKGVEEVTAAHEMLHAAYDRLSGEEQSRIDALITGTYAQLTDKRIKDTIDAYRARDPSIVPNELHSILATEVRNLGAELESYYARYFTDRQKIVNLSESYEAEFTSRTAAVAAYDTELTSLKLQIDGLTTDVDLQSNTLLTEQSSMEQLRRSDPEVYNAAVPGFNENIRSYNSDLSRLRKLVEKYNDIVSKRNQLAAEQQDLINAIDSNLDTL